MTPCYALKSVKINEQLVDARPIGWDANDFDGFGHDSDGNDVNATKWMTTCPYCGNLIEFTENNLFSKKENLIGCPTCNAGMDQLSELTIDTSDAVDPESLVNQLEVEFIDPIINNLLSIEVDMDRMPGLGEPS